MESTLKNTTFKLGRVSHAIALYAFALLIPNLASAAGWSIDPIRLELSPSKQTAAVTLTNDTDQPTSIQIQAVAWTQVDGRDVYTPTKELLVSPPIVTIAPKSVQIVRVALRKQADATKELAYRINLQELPTASTSGSSAVQVALRIGLPVFVQSQKGDAAPKTDWKVSSSNNVLKVSLRNEGTAHIQVSDFALYAPGSEQSIGGEIGSTYVLAGQTHEWQLRSTSAARESGGRLRLKAFTDAGNVDNILVLDKP